MAHKRILLTSLASLFFFMAFAQQLENYHCTWMGNTFPGGYTEGKWVQHSLHDAVVTPDGKVITATLGEEGRRRCSFYKDGKIWDNGNDRTNGTLEGVVGGDMCNGGNCFKSKTVAYHPDQTWVYGTHSDDVSIRRWHFHGLIDDNFNYNLGGRAEGLAASKQILVASLNNEITVLNIEDASELRKFEVPSPTKITLDPEGDIWVVCSGETEVREYSPEGVLKTTLTEAGWGPEDVSMDHAGRLIVSDNGPDQQVKFYDISGENPVPDGTLGQKGGITAGTPGMVTGDKLWDLKACGTDSAGNIYVIMATNHYYPTIRSYTPDGQTLRWEIHGIEFCTVADYDAQTGQFHSYYNTYTFDFAAQPDGDQWQLKSHNIDPIAYPNDMRISQGLGFSTQFRRINGKRFLYLTNMSAHNLHIYRFEDEMAVPSMAFSASSEDWALNNPGGNWIWTDKNGNGDYEAEEYTTGSGINRWSWWVDRENTIWNAYKNDIYAFPLQGLDEQGNPIYTFASRQRYDVPLPFNFVMRAKYNPTTDVMVISGYTDDHPKSEVKYGSNKGAGLVFARYDNWSESPELKWVRPLEYELVYNSWENQLWPRSFDVAGDYMFVVWGSYGPSGKDKSNPVLWSRGEVTVYDLETGEKTGYMLPDSTIGGPPPVPSRPTITGAQDMAHSVHAHQRDNGEYMVIMEENKWSKNVIYRWCPTGDCMESSMKISLSSPEPDTVLMTYNGISLVPEILEDTNSIARVDYYANKEFLDSVTAPPFTYDWPDSLLGNFVVRARVIAGSGDYKFSDQVRFTAYDGKPEVNLISPEDDGNYFITDTLTLEAETFDYDGTVDSVVYYANNMLIGRDTSQSPWTFQWANPAEDTYGIQVWAYDDMGQSGKSETIRIRVRGYRQPDNPDSTANGLLFKKYEGDWQEMPDYAGLNPSTVNIIPGFNAWVSQNVAVVSQCGQNGADGGWGVLYGPNPVTESSIQLAIDEDRMGDNERGHIPEQLAFMALTSSPDGPESRAEYGVVSGVSSTQWKVVTLNRTFNAPVIIATPNYTAASEPCVTRIKDAGGNSFKMKVDVAAPAGAVEGIDVHYLVVEEGVYDSPKFEAMTLTSDGTNNFESWTTDAMEQVSPSNAYENPVVLGQVMSYNDTAWSVFWSSSEDHMDPPSASSIYAGKHVGGDTNLTRQEETLGIIIIEGGEGSIDGMNYKTALGENTIKGIFNEPPPPYAYDLGAAVVDDQHAVYTYQGYLAISRQGEYRFYTSSRYESRLYIGDILVSGPQGSGKVLLKEGLHELKVEAFDKGGGDIIAVEMEGPGIMRQAIPKDSLYRNVTRNNTAPAVSIVSPGVMERVNQGDTLTFQATVTDPDRDVYKVAFYEHGSRIGPYVDSTHSVRMDTLSAGMHKIVARAYDLGGAIGVSDTLSLFVNARPDIRFISPAGQAEFTALDSVTIEIGVEDENTALIELYINDQLAGVFDKNPGPYTLKDLSMGVYSIKARVTDTYQLTDSARIEVEVVNTPPLISIREPEDAALFNEGETIAFQSAVTDPDNNVTKVAYYEGEEQLGQSTVDPYAADIQGLSGGSHTIIAKAFDEAGAVTTSEPVALVINARPVVSFEAPGEYEVFTTRDTIPIQVSVQDEQAKTVEIYVNDNRLGTLTEAPWDYEWKGMSAGTYSIKVIAVDTHDLASLPETRIIRVDEAVGVKSLAAGAGLRIYPNPLEKGDLYMDIPEAIRFGGSLRIVISDILGNKVYETFDALPESILSVPAGEFPGKGIYIISIRSAEQSVNKKLIVK